MTQKDLNNVVNVLKGKNANEISDWHTVLGFLCCHRIAGLFYNRAQKQGVNLPKKIDKILSEIYAGQKRKVLFMRREIQTISEALLEAKAEHILLKGSVLTNLSKDGIQIYEDGERISNDIDILVKPESITNVSNVLYSLGFVQGQFDAKANKIIEFSRLEIVKRRMNRGELAPFVKLTGNEEFPFIEVDINFSLGNTPEAGGVLLSAMLETAKEYEGKVRLSVANEEMFFLHLIMHQYKESNLMFMVERSKDLDLYKLTDIYYLLKAEAFDWTDMQELISKHNLTQQVGNVLNQVGNIFQDDTIVSLAKTYEYAQPKVIDYETKKTYTWNASERKRLCAFYERRFLTEV